MPPNSSRRAVYRVVYPLSERPIFHVERSIYEVIDCSEKGLRCEINGHHKVPPLGTQLRGCVQFRRGMEIEVTGEVIRTSSSEIVLVLDRPGLPFVEIMAEQRYLRSKGYTLRD